MHTHMHVHAHGLDGWKGQMDDGWKDCVCQTDRMGDFVQWGWVGWITFVGWDGWDRWYGVGVWCVWWNRYLDLGKQNVHLTLLLSYLRDTSPMSEVCSHISPVDDRGNMAEGCNGRAGTDGALVGRGVGRSEGQDIVEDHFRSIVSLWGRRRQVRTWLQVGDKKNIKAGVLINVELSPCAPA